MNVQRPPEAASQLFCRLAAQFPVGAPLVVAQDECAVALQFGNMLGVIPSGTYALHPQSLPMITRAISGSVFDGELWFVKTSPFRGLRMGGSVGTFIDPLTEVECSPRIMAEYTIIISDPTRFALACVGNVVESADALVAWVNGVVLRGMKQLFGQWIMVDGMTLTKTIDLQTRLADQLPSALPELEAMGVRMFALGSATIVMPEDDSNRLRAATAELARRKMAAMAAAAAPAMGMVCTRCGTRHPGGRFCVACGAPLAPG